MGKKELSIEDLLNALKNPNSVDKGIPVLAATKANYMRLGSGDKFAELGLEENELEKFLKEWTADNPYNNLTS